MTTIDHPEIPMDRKKPWRTGLSLFLVAFGIFSFSALLHFHVVHEGRSSAGSPLLAPALGLSHALGFAASLSFALLLTLWASIAFVTDQWAGPLRRIWISLVFALSLSVFVSGLDYDGGSVGGPIAARMAHVLGGDFSTFLLGILTILGFLLATNWLFFENFLALARGREGRIETGLGDVEEQLLGARTDEERDQILSAFDVKGFAKPASPSAQAQERMPVAERQAPAHPVEVEVEGEDEVGTGDERPGLAISGSLRVQPRVGRAIPVPEPEAGGTKARPGMVAGLSAEELESTRDRRDRIRSARMRRDQEVLEEILEEVRSSIGPEPDPTMDRDARDPMADLDDDLLLEKAGLALDELLGEGGGSLELNLPTEEEEAVDPRKQGQDAGVEESASETRSGGGESDRLGQEPRIQTPMGRIPVVDSGSGDRIEPSPSSEGRLGRTEPPNIESEAAESEPPSRETPDREDRDKEGPAPARLGIGLFGTPMADPREDADTADRQGRDEETKLRSESSEPGEVRASEAEVSEPEAPVDEEDAVDEGSEPVFILEPHPTVRIYHEAADGESEEYEQQELFAADPPDPELLDRAARVLLTSRRPTVSLLQRRIGLGYAEARQVMLYMQQLGALSAPDGGGPWGALISLGEWDERRS